MAPFFFDLETGGFSPSFGGRESSIFSISFGTTPKNVESFYAQPAKGSVVSRWSEKNVWEPIKRLRNVSIESEESILKKFLGRLEKLPEGQTIAGWNAGYVARPGGRGFDIPMLMARAEKYGLGGGYRQAFSKLTVRDVGQEYAYRAAKEVSRYGHLVEQGKLPETLFGQARGYAELGLSYEAGRPATERQASRYLAEEFKFVSGWKQEVAHNLFAKGGYQAHLSAADVASGLGLTETLEKGRLFKGEAGVIKWGRETLYRSLVSQAMQPAGIRKGVQEVATEKYPRLLAEAKQMEKTGGKAYRGFSERVVAGINEEAAQRGAAFGDILAGKGAPELGRVMGREGRLGSMAAEASGFSAFGRGSFAKKVPGFLWKHKVGVGIGAAVVGAWATQPLGWFSGKDDAYNTIEGLPHGGQSEKMRKLLTDFGSGWKGIFGSIKALAATPRPGVMKSIRGWVASQKPVKASIPLGGGVLRGTGQGLFSFNEKEAHKLLKTLDLGFFERRRVIPVLYGHETSEMYHGLRQFKRAQQIGKRSTFTPNPVLKVEERSKATREAFLQIKKKTKFGSHLSSAVVADEALLAASLGPKTYQATKKMRFNELKAAENAIKIGAHRLEGVSAGRITISEEAKQEAIYLTTKVKDYVLRTRKIYSSIEKKHLSKFSGFDDVYNTIEGLKHGGIAERLRKTITDFGSGWDALRGLVRASETFGKMTASKSFQRVLNEGKFVRSLGKGKYGEAELFASEFRGQKFEFVRKAGKIGKHEARAMQDIQGTVGPTLYGQRKGVLEMEYFKGGALEKDLATGLRKDKETLKALKELHGKGWQHGDIHLANIMVVETNKGVKKVGLIDLGQAKRLKGTYAEREAMKRADISYYQYEMKMMQLDPFATLSSVSGSGAANTIKGLGKGPFEHFGSPAILNKIVGFARKIFGGVAKTKAGGLPVPSPIKEGFIMSAAEIRSASPERWKQIQKAAYSKIKANKAKIYSQTPSMPGMPNVTISKDWALSKSQIAREGKFAGEKFVKTRQFSMQEKAIIEAKGKVTGVKGFVLPPPKAVVRSKIPKHEAMIAEQVASAGRKARFHKAHTEGKIRASTNAHRPGQRHTDTTGKIVF